MIGNEPLHFPLGRIEPVVLGSHRAVTDGRLLSPQVAEKTGCELLFTLSTSSGQLYVLETGLCPTVGKNLSTPFPEETWGWRARGHDYVYAP